MLAAENYSGLFADVIASKLDLLEIHGSKISLHYAKAGYICPTIRLPHTFSKLAGLSTRIYQTIRRVIGLSHGDIAHRKCVRNP